jgi:hypothetical protein
MRCLRRILGIWWYQHITNEEVTRRAQVEAIEPRIRRRRLALFGHVVRMPPGVPARDALQTQVNARLGHPPHTNWRRPPGRPANMWCA